MECLRNTKKPTERPSRVVQWANGGITMAKLQYVGYIEDLDIFMYQSKDKPEESMNVTWNFPDHLYGVEVRITVEVNDA